jgi:hypothetical protein
MPSLDVVALSPLALSPSLRILVIAGISATISLCVVKVTRRRRIARWIGAKTPGVLVIVGMTYIELTASMGPISIALVPTLILALLIGWLSANAAIYFAEDHEW